MTDFRLLGPLEALEDGHPLALPPGRPSGLLARLLLDANRVVPAETLVESLWGEDPPASARKVLQAHVSSLRKLLGTDRIATQGSGYALAAAADEIDLARFERLTAAAASESAPARRAELLRDALALWRGPALAEFRNEPFAAAAARRLNELRLGAIERRLAAELELGEHGRLVGELEPLVAEEPLRESLRGLLMLALYRSGRQAEALARYREGRRLLVEELGIEPGPALQELERAILRQDPGLREPQPAERPARGPVIGAGARLGPLLAPLCADGRELLLVELAPDGSELPRLAAELEQARAATPAARTACFTSTAPAADLARLADEQGAELIVVAAPFDPAALDELAAAAPCDVALAARPELELEATGPILVPFGGGREEWAALELGAWLSRAHGVPLRLLGVEAKGEQRDASRTLAGASLALQRFAGAAAEPVLVAPGPAGILDEDGAAIVASLPAGELDATRRELVERARVPVLLVRPGVRPGGLAPDRTLTRFSWSLRDEP
ncbi:MAG TPA: AfsR/SARP family transcriptional regulator [Gaiellaceae bacterium]|nr:AfsR/SARP family transcriptional regulator [Gaiellaceae bacterium]